MKKPTPTELLEGRNQPHGPWRAGNPIVKSTALGLLLLGAFMWEPCLIMQAVFIFIIMLWFPVFDRSRFLTLAFHLGLGSFITSQLASVPYESIRLTTDIPHIFPIDWLSVFIVAVISLTFWQARRAGSTRDYVWLLDHLPPALRGHAGGYAFAFVYGLFRAEGIIWKADTAIRARGCNSLLSLRTWLRIKHLKSVLGIWIVYLFREMDEMVQTVDYLVVSRVVLHRRETLMAKEWSPADVSIMGVLLFGVIIPRIFPSLQNLLVGMLRLI